jgi:poly-gamma-glutamate capsule biosynthesis protein CapA/YwtB (metallophosphatase superfamily)
MRVTTSSPTSLPILIAVCLLLLGFCIFVFDSGFKDDTAVGTALGSTTPSLLPEKLNLDEVFSSKQEFTTASPDTITLITTGDVIPARAVNNATTMRKDFLWPYARTASYLRDADITLINLESPLVPGCPVVITGMTFCGNPDHVLGMVSAGIDVANIANNHTQNYGHAGLESTRKILRDHGILPHGFGEIAYLEAKGVMFAFLGYNDLSGDPLENTRLVIGDIAQARKQSDVVIVSFHWGVEYVRQPSVRQIQLAHVSIDAGADLIVGNHPHWIQPIEFYKDKLIIYAHGNFIFDQRWSQETTLGLVAKMTFTGRNLSDVEFLPVKIGDWGQPFFLTGNDKTAVMEIFRKASYERRDNQLRYNP